MGNDTLVGKYSLFFVGIDEKLTLAELTAPKRKKKRGRSRLQVIG